MKTHTVFAAVLAACAAPAWAGTSISACRTITEPGFYALGKELLARETAPCILITANDVTLDLRGFSIKGSFLQDGISATGSRRNITVRNGAVLGTRIAIALGSTDGGVVENMEIGGNTAGIVLLRGRAENNLVYGSAGNGIEGFEAITAKGNLVVENFNNGIIAGPGSIVTDNLVADNGEVGIQSLGNAAGTVTTSSGIFRRNVVSKNKAAGVVVTCPALVINNAVTATASGSANNLKLSGTGCINRANLL